MPRASILDDQGSFIGCQGLVQAGSRKWSWEDDQGGGAISSNTHYGQGGFIPLQCVCGSVLRLMKSNFEGGVFRIVGAKVACTTLPRQQPEQDAFDIHLEMHGARSTEARNEGQCCYQSAMSQMHQ
ncbi:uncharacterized protein TrAFT101_011862 [Trichoderma asperellum]|uniref:uncharacterized protein n=1 Tax=Trichoderma asperellum TaxID=101201 RepID=UPI00331BE4D6|nr:hypothetical protein TrAFT101_011862 [Trichoderma asperellum]